MVYQFIKFLLGYFRDLNVKSINRAPCAKKKKPNNHREIVGAENIVQTEKKRKGPRCPLSKMHSPTLSIHCIYSIYFIISHHASAGCSLQRDDHFLTRIETIFCLPKIDSAFSFNIVSFIMVSACFF